MSILIEIYEFGQNSTNINQLRINLCNVNNYVHRYLYVYFSDIRYSCQIRNRESRDQCDNSTNVQCTCICIFTSLTIQTFCRETNYVT